MCTIALINNCGDDGNDIAARLIVLPSAESASHSEVVVADFSLSDLLPLVNLSKCKRVLCRF